MRTVVASICLVVFGATGSLFAQDAAAAAKASPYASVIGAVNKVDATGKVVTVKPDKGDDTTVKFDDRTSFLRIAAGETDMKKATDAKAADLEAGDRVIARVQTADPTGKPARTIYITKAADLSKRVLDTAAQWKNATRGLATAIDPAAKTITIATRAGQTTRETVLDISGKVDFRHYKPETGQYEAGLLASIRTGDQILVLGQRSGETIKADSIGFGSFKTIGVVVKSIDAASNTIIGTEAGSKKPITVTLRADTSVKKFSEMSANMVARMLNPTMQNAGGRGGAVRGEGAPGAAPGGAGARGGPPAGATAGGPPAGGPGGAPGGRGGPGGGRGRAGMDIGSLIEQQPTIQLAELKAGDALIVTGATGVDSAKLIATALIAGVEPILRAAPSNGADPLAGAWSVGGGGGGGDGN
jgi:hypothetical protein